MMQKLSPFITVFFSFIILLSCNSKKVDNTLFNEGKQSVALDKSARIDCDEVYKNPEIDLLSSVKIGDQEWTIYNLNVDTFRNGDDILEARNDEDWKKAGTDGIPAWCYYNNNPCNAKYGKLYNFHAVDDHRGLAPEGWHIPSDEEWLRMTKFLKDEHGMKLKSETGWFNNGNGNNSSGFNAKPAGIRYYDDEFFYYGSYAFFWTSSSIIVAHAHSRYLREDYNDRIFAVKAGRAAGMSVRLIKDYPNQEQNMPYD